VNTAQFWLIVLLFAGLPGITPADDPPRPIPVPTLPLPPLPPQPPTGPAVPF
jgi:hypothetical protein